MKLLLLSDSVTVNHAKRHLNLRILHVETKETFEIPLDRRAARLLAYQLLESSEYLPDGETP